jgi:hypothetical protein
LGGDKLGAEYFNFAIDLVAVIFAETGTCTQHKNAVNPVKKHQIFQFFILIYVNCGTDAIGG